MPVAEPRNGINIQESRYNIEQNMDDDVLTDDGIFRNAKQTCYIDLQNSVFQLKNKSFIPLLINNTSIKERIKWPWMFNNCGRDGKFKDCQRVGFG